MKKLFLLIFIFGFTESDFLKNQKKFQKVKTAYQEKFAKLDADLKNFDVDIHSMHLLIVAFKNEQKLELYVRQKEKTVFRKFRNYDICQGSGVLGPKRKQGDLQVPEGFYYIDHFNPTSNYYLSLGISYPNKSDRIRSGSGDPGGSIFIHGNCVTIGCMPMTDDKIKEIYVLACQARSSGQTKIPVYIFPYEMTQTKHKEMTKDYNNNKLILNFWDNLKVGYEKFIKSKSELIYSIDSKGDYIFIGL